MDRADGNGVHAGMKSFTSLTAPLRCCVIGASGGIGAALTAALAASPDVATVYSLSRRPRGLAQPRVSPAHVDIVDETSIAQVATRIRDEGPLDLVIVATGVLHDEHVQPEKRWEALTADGLAHAFSINAIGPTLCAKHFLPVMRMDARSVFAALSARVGSIEDNRSGGWYGYRASKAALNMLVKTLALELARRNPQGVCVALHPGTVDTGLSRPFQRGVAAERLFEPDTAAAHLLRVIDGLTRADSGQVFAWDGSRIPP